MYLSQLLFWFYSLKNQKHKILNLKNVPRGTIRPKYYLFRVFLCIFELIKMFHVERLKFN